MEVVIVKDAREAGRLAASAVTSLLARTPDAVLGLATGSSPLPLYDELARESTEEGLDLSRATAFALDEYVGLPRGHPASYESVIRREFSERVTIDPARVHSPDGLAGDLVASCAAYEDAIRDAGGIDLQILGLGADGHIGFNEPGSSLASRTRIKTLTEQTRRDNARFFSSLSEVPHHVVTQGVGTIMDARHVVLLAAGAAKAQAVHGLVEGPVTAMCVGSVLQFHPHTTVIVDEAAASALLLADYYRQAYDGKPDWQGL
ncbi:glucosamine-6-phosphate deaminase [Sinomonas sp. R1AF57]|uniref:glucosamine-6-phosphate deaminase n=1 Tax=Sinomonas sp. R1AF57 TaxID=2020377 RepID=UPI000B622D02|nr:glucosamine-6-phosphate deaminase [Sinomonas sp. R1AF57]ASN52288.1 glucosamine-6-phosphate deaminase [Sinomonas sp. R1AF57]